MSLTSAVNSFLSGFWFEISFSDLIDFALLLKGGWENDETVEEAAVREAIEEAGVRGDLMVKIFST